MTKMINWMLGGVRLKTVFMIIELVAFLKKLHYVQLIVTCNFHRTQMLMLKINYVNTKTGVHIVLL